jgi:hypothetical protein
MTDFAFVTLVAVSFLVLFATGMFALLALQFLLRAVAALDARLSAVERAFAPDPDEVGVDKADHH